MASVGIEHEAELVMRVNIASSAGHSCFKEVRSINGLVYIGFGEHVFMVDVKRSEIRRRLDGYCGGLYDASDLDNLSSHFSVLATSASEVLAFA